MKPRSDWQPSDAAALRQRRQALGVSPELLAWRACLSVAQVRQLEEGGDSCFYTAAIKERAGRRALAVLESLPPAGSP